jgi:hypothetical protein
MRHAPRPLLPWLAVTLALAASPAAAQEADDGWGQQRGAQALDSLEDLLKARIRTIPGTDVRWLVAGYLQLDAIWTRRELTGDEQDTFLVSAIPFDPASANTRLNIRASQINFLTQTPTPIGPITTVVQADLFRYDAGAKPNLNLALVDLNRNVTVGKAYATFMDDAVLPTTLDYNGPSGAVFVRQWLARVSVPIGESVRVEAAVEQPKDDESAAGRVLSASTSADRPDFAARARYESDRLHLQLSGVSSATRGQLDVLGNTVASKRFDGAGASASAAITLANGDRVLGQATTGRGIARYFNDGLSSVGSVALTPSGLEQIRVSGAFLYYERNWSDRWKSTFGGSVLWSGGTDGRRPASDLKQLDYVSANLVYRLARNLFVGGEVLWGRATEVSGERADDTRVQVSVRYMIY